MTAEDLREMAESLRQASVALRDAVREGDETAIAEAFERRRALFEAVKPVAQESVGAEIALLLRGAAEIDREAMSLAQAQLAEIRAELEEIGRAREGARAMRPGPEQARFVSKRV